ncbi:MAG: Crp/Fnr family transcriptional regulator [Clostridiales bacterium]|nr:Crp/Fnr family transcriptional regulator [Clostridiales bacterium]
MSFEEYFPVFNKLTPEEKDCLINSVSLKRIKKGTIVHNGNDDCLGLLLIISGQLRAYILSEEGREITIFRLFSRDMCLFSASCMMKNIQFDITVTAEKDTEAWFIPVDIYKSLMENSAVIANYTNDIIGTRFTDVVWLIEQIMWKSFDKRLALFLKEESAIEGTERLEVTHEKIASHLGTAREVVTRMLKYFQGEKVVSLSRGIVEITDMKKLSEMSE